MLNMDIKEKKDLRNDITNVENLENGKKIVIFPSTSGFRPFEEFFSKESIRHPAKANLHMIRWIITKYSKLGETILDPMAGTYSTCIMASLMGRNSIGIDIEDVFYKMGLDNANILKSTGKNKGEIIILQGARNISELCQNKLIDVIITSPPYAHESSEANGDTYTGHGKEIPYTRKDYKPWSTRKGGNVAKRKLFKIVPGLECEADRHDMRPERKDTPWEWTKEVKIKTGDINKEYEKIDRAESYLSAMLEIYNECYETLKSDGLMIIITKNFIRKKHIIELDLDTIKLCEIAGFTFIERWYRKLATFTFWVNNYYKKYGLRINFEDILVFRKSKTESEVEEPRNLFEE